jgi:hypothetical protein
MRTVLIRVEGAKYRIRKLQLCEGTRVSDILQRLNVPHGYILAHASAPTNPLPTEAAIDGLVADGDHLVARSRSATVGSAAAFTLTFAN